MDTVPALGEHTVHMLTELGYVPAEIAALSDQHVISPHATQPE
jgi:crotonobetainyl-CoA:carnitine CoA-transferase CaiB-like acyl-CoA transferase